MDGDATVESKIDRIEGVELFEIPQPTKAIIDPSTIVKLEGFPVVVPIDLARTILRLDEEGFKKTGIPTINNNNEYLIEIECIAQIDGGGLIVSLTMQNFCAYEALKADYPLMAANKMILVFWQNCLSSIGVNRCDRSSRPGVIALTSAP